MKKNELQISIPTPCHENWDAMTPTEIGKFCSSCQKEVIDFSVMSDQEIRKILTKSKETPCGNFKNTQLNRPIVDGLPKNRSLIWLKYAASLFLAFQGTNAISQTTNTTVSPNSENKTASDTIKKIEISGIVYDSITCEGLFDKMIFLKCEDVIQRICKTDSTGKFKFIDVQLTEDIKYYSIVFNKRNSEYKKVEISLLDFFKTNEIILSKKRDITIENKERELTVVGDIKILKPKRKWYQIWKK